MTEGPDTPFELAPPKCSLCGHKLVWMADMEQYMCPICDLHGPLDMDKVFEILDKLAQRDADDDD